jgi:hypothetical protein
LQAMEAFLGVRVRTVHGGCGGLSCC